MHTAVDSVMCVCLSLRVLHLPGVITPGMTATVHAMPSGWFAQQLDFPLPSESACFLGEMVNLAKRHAGFQYGILGQVPGVGSSKS